jgi:predicted nucleic acid-binding protein
VRALRIRLLGDRVLQNVAWTIADQLGWADTFTAEYIALTRLRADPFITLDTQLARSVQELVPTASIEAQSGPTARNWPRKPGGHDARHAVSQIS